MSVIIIGGLMLLGVAFYPFDGAVRERVNYLCLLCSFAVLATVFFGEIVKHGIDLFEPVVLISAMYGAIMIFAPLRCIVTGDFYLFQLDTMDGAFKGTVIFTISMLAFYIGYFCKISIKRFKHIKFFGIFRNIKRNKYAYNAHNIVTIAYIIWFASLFLTMIYEISIGRSPLYLFTFAKTGNVELVAPETSLGILINFEFSMIGAWMFIFAFGKKKVPKAILFLITLSVLYVRGFRFVMLILIMAPIMYIYMRKNKRPSLAIIAVGAIMALIMFASIGAMRGAIRSGGEADFVMHSFSDSFEEIFQSDFCVFKGYYNLVAGMPEKHDFTYGFGSLFYTFVMAIPRAIWPGKPLPISREVLLAVEGKAIVDSGNAFVNLGEFYMEFGAIGCIVFMWLFGWLMAKLKKIYTHSKSVDNIILYCTLLPAIIQLIGRGYMPSNAYLMLFLAFPYLIIRCFLCKVQPAEEDA